MLKEFTTVQWIGFAAFFFSVWIIATAMIYKGTKEKPNEPPLASALASIVIMALVIGIIFMSCGAR